MSTKPAPPATPSDTCSVCGHSNFRVCPCPWDRPFDDWPGGNMVGLRRIIPVGPSPGS